MILYGRNLSPYARRVAVWCALQGRAVERREIPSMGDTWDEVRAHNPVGRVPILILEDGAELIETWAICDWLEDTAPEGGRLVPPTGVPRRDCLQRLALANSTVEKVVALVYEKNRRPDEFQWPDWQERLVTQIRGGLAAMEAAAPGSGWHGGAGPDGSDIATVIAVQMAEATNPWLLEPGYPRLAALCERAMALAPFAETDPRA
jgi:Glutathione S-transferase